MNQLPKLTSEQAKILGKMGGIKSGESRRNKKTLLEIAEHLLSQKVKPELLNEQSAKLVKQGMTYAEAMVLSQIVKAINGDSHAAIYIRDISGQKEVDKTEAGKCNFYDWYFQWQDFINKEEW